MMATTRNGSSYPNQEAQLAALRERTTGIENTMQSLASQIQSVATSLTSQLQSLAIRLDERQKPNYALQITSATLILAVMSLVGNLALAP